MKTITLMKIMVLDKGYDSESIHQLIRDNKTKSIIPVRDMTALVSRIKGRYRKLMRRRFDETQYHQRNKCEGKNVKFSSIEQFFPKGTADTLTKHLDSVERLSREPLPPIEDILKELRKSLEKFLR